MPETSEAPIPFHLRPEAFIGKGMDSEVYKDGDIVRKVYYSGLMLKQIKRYSQLTNDLSKSLKDDPFDHRVTFGGRTYTVTADVVPVLSVEEREIDGILVPVASSPFILGPSLYDMTAKLARKGLAEKISEISDQFEVERLDKLSEMLKREEGDIAFLELRDALEKELARRSERRYIHLPPMNLKLRSPDEQAVHLIVTDIASSIVRLLDED